MQCSMIFIALLLFRKHWFSLKSNSALDTNHSGCHKLHSSRTDTMPSNNWTASDIPSQKAKTIVVTGANIGIGLEAATVLSGKGANVIMAVRTIEKGKAAVMKIKSANPSALLELMQLDLADFDSIHRFSEEFHAKHAQLNVLINNAGVMNPVKRELTKQGFEVQFGTNHLGHFLFDWPAFRHY